MKKQILFVIFLSAFMVGCSPHLIRDANGVKGHTDDVLFNKEMKIRGDVGEFVGHAITIPIENKSPSKFIVQEWENKIPPEKGIGGADKVAFRALYYYNRPGCGSTNEDAVHCYCAFDQNCMILFSDKNKSWKNSKTEMYIAYPSSDKDYKYNKDYLKEMGIEIDRNIYPEKLYLSCKGSGCMVVDEQGKVVNKIEQDARIIIDEQKLSGVKQAREKEIRKKQQEEYWARERAREIEQRAKEREWQRKLKRAMSDKTQTCLKMANIVQRQNRYIQYPKEVFEQAQRMVSTEDCIDRIFEHSVVEFELEQRRLKQLGY